MLKRAIKSVVPSYFHPVSRRYINKIKFFGFFRRCPVCGAYLRKFLDHGVKFPRKDAICPICGVKESHRLAWLYLQEYLRKGPSYNRLLHIGPEPAIRARLEAIPNVVYFCGDLVHAAHLRLDAARLPFREGSFGFVYCSHVLNAIPFGEDMVAIAEVYRVLKRGGTAFLQVPLKSGETVECQTRSERIEVLGDPDVYRVYGEDFKTKLESTGFRVTTHAHSDFLSHSKRKRYGVKPETFYIGSKI